MRRLIRLPKTIIFGGRKYSTFEYIEKMAHKLNIPIYSHFWNVRGKMKHEIVFEKSDDLRLISPSLHRSLSSFRPVKPEDWSGSCGWPKTRLLWNGSEWIDRGEVRGKRCRCDIFQAYSRQ